MPYVVKARGPYRGVVAWKSRRQTAANSVIHVFRCCTTKTMEIHPNEKKRAATKTRTPAFSAWAASRGVMQSDAERRGEARACACACACA